MMDDEYGLGAFGNYTVYMRRCKPLVVVGV